jgi:hypothetical protein
MATFSSYQNVLPNPSNGIAYDGSSASGNAGYSTGPGYASVQVTSQFQTSMDKTNSGILVARSKAAHSFDVEIKYNPMTEEEFMPVYSFLLEKEGMLKPFFVPLPQYDNPQDSTLAGQNPQITFTVATAASAGATQVTVAGNNSYASNNTYGQLRPGDIITFSDSSDSNHLKAYKIVRVETDTDYLGSAPTSAQLRLTLSPGLRKDVSTSATLVYKNPKIKVISKKDAIQYSLDTNNLYSFSLSLEEVQ